jgi:histidine triad (HIT) family protein
LAPIGAQIPEDLTGCVFCDLSAQPEALFETERLRVVPDKYPLLPGHTLIISRDHLDCFGAADDSLLTELEAVAATVGDFVRAAYGPNTLAWENGITGQTVFHAHLHVIPTTLSEFPVDPAHEGDWNRIDGWSPVVDHYRRHESYHYAALRGDRRLLIGDGPAAWDMRRQLAQLAGLRFIDGAWVRTTSPADVAELARRWTAY